jgi:low temperature requirement protein LtrA
MDQSQSRPARVSIRFGQRRRPLVGRDPSEKHRASTPLELLFDLTLVVAFGQAGSQMAKLLELGHVVPAILAFTFATLALCWAWVNYSWLASAFDNDGIFFRIATLFQMIGAIVLALGLPALFLSLDHGDGFDNGVVVAGYVIMRLSSIALWLRISKDDPSNQRTARRYALLIAIAQVGWVIQIVADLPISVVVGFATVLVLYELLIPRIAERAGGGTPWHARHIVERYSLLVIITLGEVIVGTVSAVTAVVDDHGWSVEAATVVLAGVSFAFGLWWIYFLMPSGEVIARHRERRQLWSYVHLAIFSSLAAVGAGLHVVANALSDDAHIGGSAALLTIAVPVAILLIVLFMLYSVLLRAVDGFHILLLVGSLVVLAVGVFIVIAGSPLSAGLLVAALSPLVIIVGYETIGHRHQMEALAADSTTSNPD